MRCLLRILLLFCVFLASAQALELRVALGAQGSLPAERAAPGKGSVQSGGLVAFNEDLARELCRRINARCTTVNVIFAEILPGIEAQNFELGFGNFLRTPEREKRAAFSDSIWRSSSRLIAAPATARAFAVRAGREVSLDNLRQARLAVVAETQQHRYLQALAEERALSVQAVGTVAEAIALVRDGQADFCLLPMLSGYALLNREPEGGLAFVGPAVADGGLGGTVHIALPKSEATLRLAVNQALGAMRADGTYLRIVRRHFPFSLD